jgi:four helix bundle protein
VTPDELRERTLVFSLAIYRFVRPLFRDPDTRHLAEQLLRCATSVAANYRAACLARSRREWTARMGIVREEADESLFWLIFLQRSGIVRGGPINELLDEGTQLARIFGAAYRTSRGSTNK